MWIGTFVKDYLLRLAFLDGWRGLALAHLAADYAVYQRLRHYELVRNPASRTLGARELEKRGLERPRDGAGEGTQP